ncbi:MAG: hypothetical protein U5K72_10035 [Balneolaceae bacterium]|nr:hypothetical protein [Balneolaceae bacterium]
MSNIYRYQAFQRGLGSSLALKKFFRVAVNPDFNHFVSWQWPNWLNAIPLCGRNTGNQIEHINH